MLKLALEYLLLVFICCCGLLQLMAVRGGFSGISFFNSKVSGYIFAALTVGGAFLWFFLVEDRYVPGLEGSQVFALFLAAAVLSLIFTFFLSSLLKRRRLRGEENREPGLDTLRRMTYLQAIARHFRKGGGDDPRR